ncbi:hypothetical protein [Marinifilum caeruleilacunae]|uniref:Lipoprotein n=1 Tax=Marinifilum caeruleilacunae TaxID=2499076 RepID=A0ABX1WXL9_9BACT|nr:hypothetical protein [Marinifilum caeruleilacunae]NOU60638.1 hypothetical protein [Marinifilum caeruleilacunae]
MKRFFYLLLLFSVLFSSCDEGCDKIDLTLVNWNGCGDFIVFDTITLPNHEFTYINVTVDREKLNLSGNYKSFEIHQNEHIFSDITKYNKQSHDFCKDYPVDGLEVENLWWTKEGTVEIRIVHDKNECEDNYVVTLILKNVTYIDSNGHEIILKEKIIENVLAGYKVG